MKKTMKIAQIGAGMFGGDIHVRTYADLMRAGISGKLGRVGLDEYTRDLADIEWEVVALGEASDTAAERACGNYKDLCGRAPKPYIGRTTWDDILNDIPDLDVMAVATPDHLHSPAAIAALKAGVHVITEKPMCLFIEEADEIIELAEKNGLVAAVDMHKRYDPDHIRIQYELNEKIGDPVYGTAVLEEPLEVSTQTFKWVEQSDPFSYVGPHWTDVIYNYFKAKPVALSAVGQKKRLIRDGINAFDAVQVRVEWDNGMSIMFQNNWITPSDFESNVNQGHEIVGTDGKVESDQQYRGLRYWHVGGGCNSTNTHFSRDVPRPDGSQAYIGYGIDSILVSLTAMARVKLFGETRDQVAHLYPTAEQGRITVAIVHAARLVRDLNYTYLQDGKGAPVSARFGEDGITIIDPNRIDEGKDAVFDRIYKKAI